MPSSSPVRAGITQNHEGNEPMGETQGMVMAALDNVFAIRRAATQARSNATPSSATVTARRARSAQAMAIFVNRASSKGPSTSIVLRLLVFYIG